MARIAIGPYGGGSGISTYTLELCKALSTVKTEHEITLFAWQGFNPMVDGIQTLSLPKNTYLGMPDYVGGPLVHIFEASRTVRRKVNQFDLVHFPDSTYGAFIKHPRLVLTTWGYFTWRLAPKWYSQRFGFPVNIAGTAAALEFMTMNTLALNNARVIISLLPLKYLPKKQVRQNTVYIPPPLTVQENSDVSRTMASLGLPDGKPVFIFGSRDLSIKGKGGQLAIDAFAKLQTRKGAEASLIMVGGKNDSLNVPNSIRDRVIFPGFLDRRDYLGLLSPGRCFLALSHGEELDYACLEAMAAGCAVIASDIPAHYVVSDHENGRIVSRDCDSIFSAMVELTDDNIRRNMGMRAAREIRKLTNPTEIAKRYLAIYERAMSA